MATMDLRPLTIGEILDRTFNLYRRHFVLFLGIMVLPQLLILAARLMQLGIAELAGVGTDAIMRTGSAGPSSGQLFSFFGINLIGGLVILFVMLVMYSLGISATTVAVSDIYMNRTPSVRGSFDVVMQRLGSIVLTLLVIGIIVFAGLIACIVPGVLLFLRYSVVMPAAVLEKLGLSDAMKRSAKLTEGRWGEAFLILLLYVVLSYVLALLFGIPLLITQFAYMREGTLPYWLQVLGQLAEFLSGLFLSPMLAIAYSIFYYDCRIRKEAYDLQLMMAAMEKPPSPSAPPAPPMSGV